MAAKVGVLLVHGIGVQRPGSLLTAWGIPLRDEVDLILREQGLPQSRRDGVLFREYVWDPHVRAFSAIIVSFWALTNLPRMSAIHASLAYHSRPWARGYTETIPESSRKVLTILFIGMWRGILLPSLLLVSIFVLWLVNPPIVLVTGVLSLMQPRGRVRWRPFRPANLLMSRVIGDAYIFLTSPVGRLLSRGSRRSLVDGFLAELDELYEDCSQVIVIAHSQGAAIAVAALRSKGKVLKPTSLVTVGGGHGFLLGLEETQIWRSTTSEQWTLRHVLTSGIYLMFASGLTLWVLPFLYFYAVLWLSVMVLTPAWFLARSVSYFAGDVLGARGLDAMYGQNMRTVLDRVVESWNWMFLGVLSATFLAVLLALYTKFGRPERLKLPLNMSWVEIWSRFDPVSFGPEVETMPRSPEQVFSLSFPGRGHRRSFETWNLTRGGVVGEHTGYFRPGGAAMRVMGGVIAARLSNRPVFGVLPGNPETCRKGRLWVRVINSLVIAFILFVLASAIGLTLLLRAT